MNNKNIIKTSHELNHFKGGYTRLELDFIYAFISTIKDEDERFKDYQLTLQDLENKLQKRLQLEKIEYIFESLIKKSFKINNDKRLAVYSFFTYLEYDKETKTMTVNFNEKLKPHLIQLKTYAKGDFKYLLQFRSEYSKRLYMLISQWKTAGKKLYSVDELREMLAVNQKYTYGEFKRTVLKKAEEELKKNSDVFFTFEEQKQGKKVTHVLFNIIRSGGSNKEVVEASLEHFKKEKVYFNGEYRVVLNVWYDKDNKGYVLVQLLDDSQDTTTTKMHLSQLEKMVEYVKNLPKLL
jgi:plasmid replication initiation protein